ncbi:MAG: S41 family peptidase [Gemmatimonadaceae bacterium]
MPKLLGSPAFFNGCRWASHTQKILQQLRSSIFPRSIATLVSVALMASACHHANEGLVAAANASVACRTGDGAAANNDRGASAPAVNAVANFDSAWAMVARSYWDTAYISSNWSAVRDTLRPKAESAKTIGELRAVLTTMLRTLNQSHFSVIPSDAAASRDGASAFDRNGVIGATVRDVQNAFLITSVRAGGAAAKAGVRAGYVIESIDGCSVATRLVQLSQQFEERRAPMEAWRYGALKLNGPVGDTVRISARDERGVIRAFAIARETQQGEWVKFGNSAPVIAKLDFSRRIVNGRSIGIITFNSWQTVLSRAFAVAMDSLRNADAIVIDVRGNFGGVATMSTSFAGHFVDSALTLGTMFMRGFTMKYDIHPQRVNTANQRVRPFSGPVAVVVDELSASTTEIFAAGMQLVGRARLFGVQTAGQAQQSVVEKLPNGDLLVHALANYLLPNGRPIEGVGVSPDVVAPVTRAALLRGVDPALDEAVTWAAAAPKSRSKLEKTVPQRD